MTKEQRIIQRLKRAEFTEQSAKQLLEIFRATEKFQHRKSKEASIVINYVEGLKWDSEKPTVYFESRHESGNIFALLGKVDSALGNKDEFNRLWAEIQKGSYEQAIQLIKEKVMLIDLDEVY